MTHEVYIGRVDGQVVYVGEGKCGRHRHLNSGTSSVYDANRTHFSGQEIEIEVIPVESKECAMRLEKELIKDLSPPWNTQTTRAASLRQTIRVAISRVTLSKPLVEQHYLIGLICLASESISGDGSFIVHRRSHGNRVRISAVQALVAGTTTVDGVIAEKTSKHSNTKITFSDDFLQPENLERWLRRKAK